ncbi:MAG TPA: hypothetical protein VLM42_07760 [Bryobacteraceae bacterium]|nr:hypothetical protein [Bryobacteraceae bacterium]
MADFDATIAKFAQFASEQGYPNSFLWTSPNFVLIWRRRFFVLIVDPEEQRAQAKASYDSAIARNIGVAVEALCKTQNMSVCRVYGPTDEADAQYRMISTTDVKMSVAVDPLPTVLVGNRLLWWMLKRLKSSTVHSWD